MNQSYKYARLHQLLVGVLEDHLLLPLIDIVNQYTVHLILVVETASHQVYVLNTIADTVHELQFPCASVPKYSESRCLLYWVPTNTMVVSPQPPIEMPRAAVTEVKHGGWRPRPPVLLTDVQRSTLTQVNHYLFGLRSGTVAEIVGYDTRLRDHDNPEYYDGSRYGTPLLCVVHRSYDRLTAQLPWGNPDPDEFFQLDQPSTLTSWHRFLVMTHVIRDRNCRECLCGFAVILFDLVRNVYSKKWYCWEYDSNYRQYGYRSSAVRSVYNLQTRQIDSQLVVYSGFGNTKDLGQCMENRLCIVPLAGFDDPVHFKDLTGTVAQDHDWLSPPSFLLDFADVEATVTCMGDQIVLLGVEGTVSSFNTETSVFAPLNTVSQLKGGCTSVYVVDASAVVSNDAFF